MAVAVAVIVMTAFTVPAHAAHLLGNNGSVDGRQIRYKFGVDYAYPGLSNKSIGAWNAGGCIGILPDSASTVNDVTLNSGFYGATGWDGRWLRRTGGDLININRTATQHYADYKIKGVITHELGHALGIADHTSASWGHIIMASTTGQRYTSTVPKAHDIVDYEAKWGNCW